MSISQTMLLLQHHQMWLGTFVAHHPFYFNNQINAKKRLKKRIAKAIY